MTQVVIREMTNDDIDAVAGLCEAVLAETWLNPATLEAVTHANGNAEAWRKNIGTRQCFVAARDEELVGVAWVFINGTTAHVGGAFVRHRGEGIGGLLLDRRLRHAVASGCGVAHAVVVAGNIASRRNLESRGFVMVEESDREWTFTRSLVTPDGVLRRDGRDR